MTDDSIQIRGIIKSFGPVRVLHGIDLALPHGSVTALLGENGAGKSTLVRIIAGDHRPDSGEILINGQRRELTVESARREGIRLITQEISDAPTLSVAENVVIGDWPAQAGAIDRRAIRKEASAALARVGADLDLGARQGNLRLGERQLVEIARALRGESRLIIFDEPTASLSDAEAKILYDVVAQLKAEGIAVLYITHRMDEVFAIADRVCVLRDGLVSLHSEVSSTTPSAVVEAMVGRKVEQTRGIAKDGSTEAPSLSVSSASAKGFTDVSMELHAGRITGIYGKLGSGVAELADAMFGCRPLTEGTLELDGRPVRLRSPKEAIRHGIGYLPPDRARDGAFLALSVARNLAAPSWPRLAKLGMFVRTHMDAAAYRRWHGPLAVRSTSRPSQKLGTLSGGNQQKVLLGRWLEAGSKILVLTEPTRGVDVGARQEIYAVLRELAESGSTVVVASSDYEDILAVADVAHVMVRGKVVATLPHAEIDVQTLTEAAGGNKNDN